ncbi:hypothetical protein F5Y16DRAFT_46446 [Xylariaceae sp. FL0255]|nr:hypothetical protein F5Y16DRAFT_46446 [Xylariaceae sp. FL0255]
MNRARLQAEARLQLKPLPKPRVGTVTTIESPTVKKDKPQTVKKTRPQNLATSKKPQGITKANPQGMGKSSAKFSINSMIKQSRRYVSNHTFIHRNSWSQCFGIAHKRNARRRAEITIAHSEKCSCRPWRLCTILRHADKVVAAGKIDKEYRDDLVILLKMRKRLAEDLPDDVDLPKRKKRAIQTGGGSEIAQKAMPVADEQHGNIIIQDQLSNDNRIGQRRETAPTVDKSPEGLSEQNSSGSSGANGDKDNVAEGKEDAIPPPTTGREKDEQIFLGKSQQQRVDVMHGDAQSRENTITSAKGEPNNPNVHQKSKQQEQVVINKKEAERYENFLKGSGKPDSREIIKPAERVSRGVDKPVPSARQRRPTWIEAMHKKKAEDDKDIVFDQDKILSVRDYEKGQLLVEKWKNLEAWRNRTIWKDW